MFGVTAIKSSVLTFGGLVIFLVLILFYLLMFDLFDTFHEKEVEEKIQNIGVTIYDYLGVRSRFKYVWDSEI